MSGTLSDYAREAVERGMATAEVADRVWDAIVNNQFSILTHAEMREFPVARMCRAADQTNPLVAQQ